MSLFTSLSEAPEQLQQQKTEKIEGREERAKKLVEDYRVKKHIFLPSGRTIWSVVGRDGDMMVTLGFEGKLAPYCSCDDYHFRVLGGEISECYHLKATKIALEKNRYSITNFSDEEYEPFLHALISDIFSKV